MNKPIAKRIISKRLRNERLRNVTNDLSDIIGTFDKIVDKIVDNLENRRPKGEYVCMGPDEVYSTAVMRLVDGEVRCPRLAVVTYDDKDRKYYCVEGGQEKAESIQKFQIVPAKCPYARKNGE